MKMSSRVFSVVCGVFVILVVAIAAAEWRRINELRGESTVVGHASAELAASRERSDRLAAMGPTIEERESLDGSIQEFDGLLSERDALRAQLEDSVKAKLLPKPPRQPEEKESRWANAGRLTPSSAVETVFWSIERGDVDLLATLIDFDDGARAEALRLYDVLPEDLLDEYDSSTRLVAALMAVHTPLLFEELNVLGETSLNPGETFLRLATASGQTTIKLRRDANGWRLLVPALIVDGYRHHAIGTTSLVESNTGF